MAKKIEFSFFGDLMLGEWHFCQGFGISRRAKKGNLHQLFENVRPLFDRSDLVIGNLEGPAGTPAESLKKPLMVNENFIPVLKDNGIDVISIANNHLMEYGDEKALSTIESLKKSGLMVSGVAGTPSVTVTIDNKTIEIISADILPAHHERKGYPAEPKMFSGRLENIGEIICDRLDYSEADYRFVYLHWGEEFMFYPCPLQVRWAHRFIDHGADSVIGSHPHVPQGVEQYKGKIIAYSLGNFISDMPYPITKKGYILTIRIGADKNFDHEIIPYEIDKNFTPQLSNEEESAVFIKSMDEQMSIMDTEAGFADNFEKYTQAAVQAENEMWDWVKGFYKRNVLKYPIPVQWGWIKEKLGI